MRVKDHRKAIPQGIKLRVLLRQARCTVCGERFGVLDGVEFDHRPALMNRPFVESTGDFDPPQNDPNFIDATHEDCHLYRTVGRKPGTAKTLTTRGSDIGEAKRTRRILKEQEEFRNRLLAKDRGEEKPKSRWPKRQFQRKPKTGDGYGRRRKG